MGNKIFTKMLSKAFIDASEALKKMNFLGWADRFVYIVKRRNALTFLIAGSDAFRPLCFVSLETLFPV